MGHTIQLLHLGGENRIRASRTLRDDCEDISVTAEPDTSSAISTLETDPDRYDCVLSVHAPPAFDAIERYRRFEQHPTVRTPPFVVLADAESETVAVEALNAGIDGYVQADTSDTSQRLIERIRTVVEQSDTGNWRLQRLHDRLETFRGVVSHDLRTPLNAAKGHLELARSGDVNDTEELLDTVADALDRLEVYLADLNTLEQQGTPVEAIEDIEIADIAETTWNRIQTGSATVDIRATRSVSANRDRLVEAFRNVYRNAIDHGGEGVTVTVGDLEDGFYIEDDGPGLERGQYSDIFEPGFSTTEGATGLGLAIVAQIAAAHRWEISAAEGADGGVCVKLTSIDRPS
jgi:signal transduction histidine kinase